MPPPPGAEGWRLICATAGVRLLWIEVQPPADSPIVVPMMQPSRIAKRFLIPVLLAATLVVAVQVVLAAPPDTGFSVAPDPPVCGQTAAFTSSASDPDGDLITLVEWDFDYAGTFTADATTGSSVDHVFTTPGSH